MEMKMLREVLKVLMDSVKKFKKFMFVYLCVCSVRIYILSETKLDKGEI